MPMYTPNQKRAYAAKQAKYSGKTFGNLGMNAAQKKKKAQMMRAKVNKAIALRRLAMKVKWHGKGRGRSYGR